MFAVAVCGGFFLSERKVNPMKKQNLRTYLALAMFTAIAYISLLFMKIGGIGGFLTFDIKDAVITIAAMQFGPLSGVIISLLVSLIEMFTLSETGFWGFLMNFIGSAAFAAIAAAIYLYMPRVKKTMTGAVLGLSVGVLSMTVLMLVMNVLITPIYTGAPLAAIYEMMLPLLLPFNFIKALANAAVVFVLYKPVCEALRRVELMEKSATEYHASAKTVVYLLAGIAVLVACVLFLILGLGGHFEWFTA